MKTLDNVQRNRVNELTKAIQRVGQETVKKKPALTSGGVTEEKENINVSVSKLDALKVLVLLALS